jgi:SH3 domain-containing YSC84-like protein 1
MKGGVHNVKKVLITLVAICGSLAGVRAATIQQELQSSAVVFREIMATPDKGIPQDLLDKAYCVVIVPGLKKAAFVIGGQYGKGVVLCRKTGGVGWGAPAAIRVEGGSFGFQIGGSSTDVIMLIMNDSGMKKLERSKFTLGADASVAAGPVGRTAEADTDAYLNAEILTYSRAKGLFAGVALNGATLRPDKDDNQVLYGKPLETQAIVMTAMQPPAAAHALIDQLDRYAGRRGTNADRSK